MSESETIWIATDLGGWCGVYFCGDAPKLDGKTFRRNGGDYTKWPGPNKPPPGECVEYVLTRKGEQPSGEAWERLLNAVADYARNSGLVGPRGEKIKDAWKAYEAASTAKPPESQIDQRGLIKQLTKERDELEERLGAVEFDRNSLKKRLKEGTQRLVAMIGSNGPEDLGEVIDRLIKRCEEKHNELSAAITKLANERAASNQVIAERDATIAGFTTKFEKLYIDFVNGENKIGQLEGEVAELQAALARKTQCNEALQADLAAHETAVEALTAQVAELQAKLAAEANQHDLSRNSLKGYIKLVAELEAKLERPEMPECVRELCNIAEDSESFQVDRRQSVAAVEAHYAPPAGHEWQPVDAANPITAEDVGRKVAHRNGGVSTVDRVSGSMVYVGCCPFFTDGRQERGVEHYVDITRILRPIDQPFKFEVGGIYVREPYGHDELELLKILDDRMLFYLRSYSEVAWTDSKGETNGWKIIRRVR
jgi:hypothetical protein